MFELRLDMLAEFGASGSTADSASDISISPLSAAGDCYVQESEKEIPPANQFLGGSNVASIRHVEPPTRKVIDLREESLNFGEEAGGGPSIRVRCVRVAGEETAQAVTVRKY